MLMLTILTLALVGGRAVTNRDVYIDLFTQPENVAVLKKTLSANPKIDFSKLPLVDKNLFDNSLNKYITQMMIVEEAKVVGTFKVSKSAVENRFLAVKAAWGADNWVLVARYFDLTESEVRGRLEKSLLVEQTIENRIRLSVVGEESAAKKTELAQVAIEDWLAQLRSRYRVQYLKSTIKGSSQAEAR